jgi:hypothetical protein
MLQVRLTLIGGKQQIDFSYPAAAAAAAGAEAVFSASSFKLFSSITNSVKPHFKQTKISGNTKTWGLSISFKSGR